MRRILEGGGKASPSERRAAFDNGGITEAVGVLVDKVARHPSGGNETDISAARKADLTEDQIFELVVCAAVGQATRQYDAALAALDVVTAPAATRRHQVGKVPA